MREMIPVEENVADIRDCWHTRQAVPFAVRAGCVPHSIGTDSSTCSHAKVAALNSDLEWLQHDDTCIHVHDSNPKAFTARSIRDDTCPSMRRRVRGAGITAGNGDVERLRQTIDTWKNAQPNTDRVAWNQRQFTD